MKMDRECYQRPTHLPSPCFTCLWPSTRLRASHRSHMAFLPILRRRGRHLAVQLRHHLGLCSAPSWWSPLSHSTASSALLHRVTCSDTGRLQVSDRPARALLPSHASCAALPDALRLGGVADDCVSSAHTDLRIATLVPKWGNELISGECVTLKILVESSVDRGMSMNVFETSCYMSSTQ